MTDTGIAPHPNLNLVKHTHFTGDGTHATGAPALYLGRYDRLSPAQVGAAIKGAAVAPGTVSKDGRPIIRLDVLPS